MNSHAIPSSLPGNHQQRKRRRRQRKAAAAAAAERNKSEMMNDPEDSKTTLRKSHQCQQMKNCANTEPHGKNQGTLRIFDLFSTIIS